MPEVVKSGYIWGIPLLVLQDMCALQERMADNPGVSSHSNSAYIGGVFLAMVEIPGWWKKPTSPSTFLHIPTRMPEMCRSGQIQRKRGLALICTSSCLQQQEDLILHQCAELYQSLWPCSWEISIPYWYQLAGDMTAWLKMLYLHLLKTVNFFFWPSLLAAFRIIISVLLLCSDASVSDAY